MNTTSFAISHNQFSRTHTHHHNQPHMSVIHEKSPSHPAEARPPANTGEVISIFGDSEKKRQDFARQLAANLGYPDPVSIDLSEVNDPDFNIKLEKQKRKLCASNCPIQKAKFERLKVALNAESWADKPTDVLNPEERAKMWLMLKLAEYPGAVIINRPTVIGQFNRKIRALRQVDKRTYIMTEKIWNYPLSVTSHKTFEQKGKVFTESLVSL